MDAAAQATSPRSVAGQAGPGQHRVACGEPALGSLYPQPAASLLRRSSRPPRSPAGRVGGARRASGNRHRAVS